MLLPDVNILVCCFRTDSPFHEACRTWLEKLAVGGEVLACSRQTLASVVRITTSRRAYREPSNLEEAIGFCNDILAYESCQLIEPGEHF